jgi:hypothetical protein
MTVTPDIELCIRNITPENRKAKFAKAIRSVAQYLGVPVSIERKKEAAHTHGTGEPFLFRAHEELIYKWYNVFSTALDETYNLIISYFSLPEMRIISKAGPDQVLTHKGKILYSPETGEPIKRKDWEEFVKLLEKFLNQKLKDTDKKIILDSKALGRILNRMLKYNKLPDVTSLPLDKIKYRGKTLSWISESIKNMRSVMGESLSRPEMATIQVMQLSTAQRITGVTEKVRADVKQLLIDGVLARKSKSQISQDLFHSMTGHNRDFQRIVDTEIQNSLNNALLLDEVHNAKPGEKIYFQRVEVIDDNTCPFCREMNGTVVLWSDNPLESDKINDPQAKYAIWEGKNWEGKKNVVVNGVFHPYCRGTWTRYNAEVNALIAKAQQRAERWNDALDQAEQEWKLKGIADPNDQTPGFVDRINELYNEITHTEETKPLTKSLVETSVPADPPRDSVPISYAEQVFRALYGDTQQRTFQKSLTFSGHKLAARYRFAGFDISVENKAGSIRSGKDQDGHKWHTVMHYEYGYIRGSVGVDGDQVDVYIGPDEAAPFVYVVHQNDPTTGKYDEDKVMLGFSSLKEARAAYLKQYDRPGFLGTIDRIPLEEFRDKVLSKDYQGKMVKSFAQRVRAVVEVASRGCVD